ncbi:MAG: cell division protein ZapA, partial [Nitrospirae bacterium]|nr:cell division protein ZapA [Nitrospirota bacterium]
MKKQIEVEIYGQKYTIAGEADEAYVNKLARYVDGKMRELAKTGKDLPTTKLALLAAVNITHELFELRKDKQAKESLIEKKTKDLIENIEEQFGDM